MSTVTALNQLPSPPRDFTGRTTELDELLAAITQRGVTLCGLYGMAGIGKTTLAIRLAEHLTPRYPDAQLYLDLNGIDRASTSAAEAMAYVISAYHSMEPLPTSDAALRGRYHAVLHGQRALLVMDNAASREQVELLIPPASCLFLVTSRENLILPGLLAKRLDPLPPLDARTLVITIAPHVGEYADTLAKLCGYLPYAIRVAARTLAEHIDLSPHTYVQRLTDTQQRLGLIDALLSVSFERLSPEIQEQWCLLALFPSLFDVGAAALVLNLELALAQDILSMLVRCSLVEWVPAIARYHLHDLARVFALAQLERIREHVSFDWAATQHNLGNALRSLGEREAGTQRLEEAVTAYREALKGRTREHAPLQWAMTQHNLGIALSILGWRRVGRTALEEAILVFRAALEERTRERDPLGWAATQHHLGIALRNLGERGAGKAALEEAIVAFREALKERTRERVPREWAATQNSLGNALRILGKFSTATLKEAIVAFRSVLKERTRERDPLDWAMTQNNLGTALATLGRRRIRTATLEKVLIAYRAALEEWTRERRPLDWAMSQHNLGIALMVLGVGKLRTATLEEAIRAFRAALEEQTLERVPLLWAATQHNLGIALLTLGFPKHDATLICDGLGSHLMVWEVFPKGVQLDFFTSVSGVKLAIFILKVAFKRPIWQACLAKHEESLRRMGLFKLHGFDPSRMFK